MENKEKAILLLFKDLLAFHNSRTIGKILGISHAGAFKLLKRLEKNKIVKPTTIGKAITYSLNLEDNLTLREIEIALIKQSREYKRWAEEFKEIESKVSFLIIFGSILRNEKFARDIDLLLIVNEKNFKEIRSFIERKNKILIKPIHPIYQTLGDFKRGLESKKDVLIEIVKTGIVLSGHSDFIDFLNKIKINKY
jgi:predicted nucleotidyltransferase